MILTLKELAEHLKLNDRTILRMLKTGQIQGVKIGGQWRFNGSQIDRIFFPSEPPSNEDVPLSELTQNKFEIPLSRLVNENRIFLDIQAEDVEGVITELTAPKLFNSLVLDIQDLRTKCLEREAMLSTGIGNCIAIPHPREPITTLRASGVLIIGRSKNGIDYNAPDGKPCHYFFLLCSQNIELHLHLMGKLANLLNDKEFQNTLETATEPMEVFRAILAHERSEFLKENAEK